MRSNVPIRKSHVGYLDSINKPATDIATVYEMLKRADRIKLKLPSIVIVLDQAMYAKACEVKFKRKEQFKDVVLFMGTFHTLMMILGIMGKIFGNIVLGVIFFIIYIFFFLNFFYFFWTFKFFNLFQSQFFCFCNNYQNFYF